MARHEHRLDGMQGPAFLVDASARAVLEGPAPLVDPRALAKAAENGAFLYLQYEAYEFEGDVAVLVDEPLPGEWEDRIERIARGLRLEASTGNLLLATWDSLNTEHGEPVHIGVAPGTYLADAVALTGIDTEAATLVKRSGLDVFRNSALGTFGCLGALGTLALVIAAGAFAWTGQWSSAGVSLLAAAAPWPVFVLLTRVTGYSAAQRHRQAELQRVMEGLPARPDFALVLRRTGEAPEAKGGGLTVG